MLGNPVRTVSAFTTVIVQCDVRPPASMKIDSELIIGDIAQLPDGVNQALVSLNLVLSI